MRKWLVRIQLKKITKGLGIGCGSGSARNASSPGCGISRCVTLFELTYPIKMALYSKVPANHIKLENLRMI
jgi:hypothetical protein